MDLSYPYEVTDKKERAYIRKRKRAAFLHSLCFYVCRLFPIKKIWFRCVRLKDEADLDAIRSMLYKNCISVIPIMSLSGL